MKLKELRKLDECPKWLKSKSIRVSGEDVEIENGIFIWHKGIWHQGTWEDGVWENGYWSNGCWRKGIWKNGMWTDGHWIEGTWVDGFWGFGHWKKGYWFKGAWTNGHWHDGIWYNGEWKTGIWDKGEWYNGWRMIGYSKWETYYNAIEEKIKIGCITKTIEGWDDFFVSGETMETSRDTEEFNNIYKSYLMAKYAIAIEMNNKKELT